MSFLNPDLTFFNMRSVAIITGPETHLDHLGVLSACLNIPLIVTEEKTFELAKHYYPDLDVTLKYLDELSLDYLATNYDVIFETGKFWAAELNPLFKLLHGKNMRFVFCPHGNSDKGHSLQTHVDQDIALFYGDHLKELLNRTGALSKIKHLVRTGNYRYSYYMQHRCFFDALAEEKVFSHFKNKKPTILYAPTWQDKENPTSFFSSIDALIDQLTPQFNLLIKLHPFLLEDHPAQVYHIMSRYENNTSVLFLNNFTPIYPLLARCDHYLGDYSSIGYDFLAFNRPLFFLNPNKSLSSLTTCGLEISDISKILDSIDSNNDFSYQRQSIYSYAFGETIDSKIIREQILKIIFN